MLATDLSFTARFPGNQLIFPDPQIAYSCAFAGGGAGFPLPYIPAPLVPVAPQGIARQRFLVSSVQYDIPIDFGLPIDATGAPAPNALQLATILNTSNGPIFGAPLSLTKWAAASTKDSQYEFVGVVELAQPADVNLISGLTVTFIATVLLPVPTVPTGTTPGGGGPNTVTPTIQRQFAPPQPFAATFGVTLRGSFS